MENNQIIVVSGPKQGVGKSIFATNFAINYASVTKKQVVILDLDKGCKQDIANYLNIKDCESFDNLWSMVQNLDVSKATIDIFKGKIQFSPKGVGVISFGKDQVCAQQMQPAKILKILAIFSKLYTFVIDTEEMSSELQTPLLDVADFVFWMILPYTTQLKYTQNKFDVLSSLNFNLDKFGVIINQSDIQGAITLKDVNVGLRSFKQNVLSSIPQEKDVLRAVNNQQILVTEFPRTKFARSIRELTDLVIKRKQEKKEKIWQNILATDIKIEDIQEYTTKPTTVGKVDKTAEIKSKIHALMVKELKRKTDIDSMQNDPKRIEEFKGIIKNIASKILTSFGNLGFTRQENERIIKEIIDESIGLGPLEDILSDKSVTEIMVNGRDQIYIERKGQLKLLKLKFTSDEQVVQVIRRIISPLGRRIDESVPYVDARLKDGSRVNAIIPPLVVQGPMLTIRRFPEKALTDKELINFGSVTKEIMDFLKACVICEKNIIVSGGTGSGKTTFLNVLSNYIPDEERILTVEDVAELQLQKRHLGRLESRPPNVEGKGEVTIRDLIKNTLRMRPDRIIVGECRGGEALDMLQAMNTGHEGSMSTIHANNARDMIGRLEAMVLMAGAELPVAVVRNYIASAINIIVQISRFQDGTRKIVSISEIISKDEKGNIAMQDIFVFERTGVDKLGKVLGKHTATGVTSKYLQDFKARGINLTIDILKKRK